MGKNYKENKNFEEKKINKASHLRKEIKIYKINLFIPLKMLQTADRRTGKRIEGGRKLKEKNTNTC